MDKRSKAALKDAEARKDGLGHDRMKLYVAIAAALIAIAVVTTIGVGIASNSGSCPGSDEQYYDCVQQLAYATSNSQMCAQLPNYYADTCYTYIAENTLNPSVCESIPDGSPEGACITYIANATDDPNLCASLNSSTSSGCLEQVAVGRNRSSACELSANSSDRIDCLSAAYFNEGVNRGNETACSMIPSDNDTNVTLASLGLSEEYSGQSYNVSQIIDYASFSNLTIGARDACYISLAYEYKSDSYCANVSNSLGQLCNITATRFGTYINSTSSMNYTSFLNQCASNYSIGGCNYTTEYIEALATGNVTMCGKLPMSYLNQCYYSMAERYNSTADCSYIKNYTINNACVLTVTDGYTVNDSN